MRMLAEAAASQAAFGRSRWADADPIYAEPNAVSREVDGGGSGQQAEVFWGVFGAARHLGEEPDALGARTPAGSAWSVAPKDWRRAPASALGSSAPTARRL